MPLPLREILDVDAVRRGQPRVVAAADKLDTPVRWVHAAELADIGLLLRGGELLLSTGIALPSSATGLAEYVAGLAGAGVAGLAIELGRRFTGSLPPALITAAEAHGLPLVAFEREVPFVEITEAVHARIIDAQFAELRAAQKLHEVFTALSVSGAAAREIVAAASRLAGQRVILADLSGRVLAVSGGPGDPPEGFAERARAACEGRPRTFWAATEGWLVTTVGAQGEDWGRLFLDSPAAPSPEDTVLVERAAVTLALGRLLARQAESLERHAHRTLLSAIIEGETAGSPGSGQSASAEARARAMGVPVTGRQLVGLVARIPDAGPGLTAHAAVFGVAEAIADACRDTRVPALVGTLDEVRAGALLSLPPQGDTDAALRQVGGRLEAALSAWSEDGMAGAVVGVGAPAGTLREARRSLLDAREVADVALRHPDGRAFYRLPDLRLRGLLHLLRDDARLRSFADRELGPLLEYDAAHGTSLLADLSVYLQAGGNKAVAAERAHLARPTFYQRLRLIERVLGVSLAEPESRVSLHAALLALRPDALPATRPQPVSSRPVGTVDSVAEVVDSDYWDDVYAARASTELSWYQGDPAMSFRLVTKAADGIAGKDTAIVDAGGGTSLLAQRLADAGFTDLTVVDVSAAALRVAASHPGSDRISWIAADLLTWRPERAYQAWHDRAVFHFLTDAGRRAAYFETVRAALPHGGAITLATFAADGPEQCSGLPVSRYDQPELAAELQAAFGDSVTVTGGRREEHRTPWAAIQPFTWITAELTRSA